MQWCLGAFDRVSTYIRLYYIRDRGQNHFRKSLKYAKAMYIYVIRNCVRALVYTELVIILRSKSLQAYMVNTYSTYSKRPLKGHVFCPKYVEYVEYEVEYV